MNLLSMILPGLRELRTPLTSGALWAVTLWLLLYKTITPATSPQIFDAVDTIGSITHGVGTVSIVAFASYLIGVAIEPMWRSPLALFPNVSPKGAWSIHQTVTRALDQLPDREVAALAHCHRPLRPAVYETYHSHERQIRARNQEVSQLRDPEHLDEDELPSEMEAFASRDIPLRDNVARVLNIAVRSELPSIATRLSGENAELFQQYDRMRSEAEFRAAVALPIAAISGIAIGNVAPLSVAIVVPMSGAIALIYQAAQRRTEAGDHIADALALSIVKAPSLEPIVRGRFTAQSLYDGEILVPAEGDTLDSGMKQLGFSGFQRGFLSVVTVASETLLPTVSGPSRLAKVALNPLVETFNRRRDHLHVSLLSKTWERSQSDDQTVGERDRIASEGDTPATHMKLGDFYRANQAFDLARHHYTFSGIEEGTLRSAALTIEQAYFSSLNSGNINILGRLVDLLAEQDRLAEAKTLCAGLAKSGHVLANIALGDVFRALGEPQHAESSYKRACPEFPEAFARLGELLVRQNRPAEAADAFRAAAAAGVEGDRVRAASQSVS